jgi:ornithine cyclodeaminase/alanine dehydrogenase-like protein (mu-crystallin family)
VYGLAISKPLAMVDFAFVTAARIALVGALASDPPAFRDAHDAAIIGVVQGDLQLRHPPLVRAANRWPAYDTDTAHAQHSRPNTRRR